MILDKLAAHARERVEDAKKKVSFDEVKTMAEKLPKGDFRFEKALKKEKLSFICEVKKASPSKGIIDETFDYLTIAKDYEKAGADCISCLTEPKWFLGTDEIFGQIRKTVSIPMIRKDFTVDAYQIYEAKCMGADAVLLICAILDTETIREYLKICDLLGISALVEAHNEAETQSAIAAGARIIGINNRNLKDFTVDISNAEHLRKMIPETITFVAESGITSEKDAAQMKKAGADAILVGEYLMRKDDKHNALALLREAAK